MQRLEKRHWDHLFAFLTAPENLPGALAELQRCIAEEVQAAGNSEVYVRAVARKAWSDLAHELELIGVDRSQAREVAERFVWVCRRWNVTPDEIELCCKVPTVGTERGAKSDVTKDGPGGSPGKPLAVEPDENTAESEGQRSIEPIA